VTKIDLILYRQLANSQSTAGLRFEQRLAWAPLPALGSAGLMATSLQALFVSHDYYIASVSIDGRKSLLRLSPITVS